MDRSSNLSSGGSLSSGLLLSQSKDLNKGSERSLESVLQSSKQKVSAIESMLRGLHVSDRQNPAALRSSSLDLGIELLSFREYILFSEHSCAAKLSFYPLVQELTLHRPVILHSMPLVQHPILSKIAQLLNQCLVLTEAVIAVVALVCQISSPKYKRRRTQEDNHTVAICCPSLIRAFHP